MGAPELNNNYPSHLPYVELCMFLALQWTQRISQKTTSFWEIVQANIFIIIIILAFFLISRLAFFYPRKLMCVWQVEDLKMKFYAFEMTEGVSEGRIGASMREGWGLVSGEAPWTAHMR